MTALERAAAHPVNKLVPIARPASRSFKLITLHLDGFAHLLNALGVTSPQRFIERKRRGLPPHEVFVDRICGEAILKGADIFVKGIRAASMGLAAGDIVSVYVDVTGRLTRGQSCEAIWSSDGVGWPRRSW